MGLAAEACTALLLLAVSKVSSSNLLNYMSKHFRTGANTDKRVLRVIAKKQAVLLKSVCRHVFVRHSSTGGLILNKVHTEDQLCLSGWDTHRQFIFSSGVRKTKEEQKKSI